MNMNKPLLYSVALAVVTLLPFNLSAQDLLPKKKGLGEKTYAVKTISSSQPLYLLKTDSANVPINQAALQELKQEWVKSVSVLKDTPAVEQFGAHGKHGVVLIELEPAHEQAYLQLLKKQKASSETARDTNLDGGTGVALPVPLYLVKTQTGEVAVSKEKIALVNPQWIKSIEVLKDAEAEKRYQEQGKNGVILITFLPEKEQEVLRQVKANK